MKKTLLFTLWMFSTVNIFSQKSSIAAIDEAVVQIKTNLETLQKEEKKTSAEGYRHVYYNEDGPKMIVLQENGKIEKNVAWYFRDRLLIYTETNWTDSVTGKNLYREKTYHDKSGMIAWLNSEDTFVRATSDEFKKMNRELGAQGRKLLEETNLGNRDHDDR